MNGFAIVPVLEEDTNNQTVLVTTQEESRQQPLDLVIYDEKATTEAYILVFMERLFSTLCHQNIGHFLKNASRVQLA